MKKFFGTDGIRGRANSGLMTAEVAMKLGMAVGSIFTRGEHRHQVLIGKDTRLSGYLFEPALTAGFIAVGMDVVLAGPIPTPAVAMMTKSLRADLGVMISASHNPYFDNGIKLFDASGLKLSNELELEIERLLSKDDLSHLYVRGELLGRARRLNDAAGRYIEFVKNTFPKKLSLNGLKIVIDCANGAAYNLGPAILYELGAEVISIGVSPDGFNINENCGSGNLLALQQKVIETGADLGIALDGDADRVEIVDEKGCVVGGDQLIAMIATYAKQNHHLKGEAIVATSMSNLALEHYLRKLDIGLIRTDVGDRYVALAMQEHKCNVGGEQSGHIILSDFTTTGDGLIAALQVLSILLNQHQPLSMITKLFEPFPQLLRNVRFTGVSPLKKAKVKSLIAYCEAKVQPNGRLLIRKSGTEPMIRIMLEGSDMALLQELADELVKNMI